MNKPVLLAKAFVSYTVVDEWTDKMGGWNSVVKEGIGAYERMSSSIHVKI